MMVTFVCECEKKALPKTRRVLDAFANRIGSRTWQTVITLEGLDTVKKLLRKTASKSTAVSCHWIRSRSRSELVWVVGNRTKFDSQGNVPVNATETDISQFQDNSQWQTINVIHYAAVIAGLFHDFGKANQLFQQKINPDIQTSVFEPYRHEWISLRLFQAFVGEQTDSEWLGKLSEVSEECVDDLFRDGIDGEVDSANHPILRLPSFGRLVAWIILSHHRLPLVPAWKDDVNSAKFKYVDEWLAQNFGAIWNSYKCQEEDQQARLEENWAFSNQALPYHSTKWRSHACIIASEAKEALATFDSGMPLDFINDHLFTSHLARLSMMLADHYYSSQKQVTPKWRGDSYNVYANTYGKYDVKSGFKQQLDEHLIGVAYHSGRITKSLPKLSRSLRQLGNNNFLTNPVSKQYKAGFGWQDKAVKLVEKIGKDTLNNGFFGINMASTGKGKTIANAKIMYALGEETGRIRFSVAMGLRTLTLQTGREFQDKKGMALNSEEVAIAVGGTAVKQLFEYNQASEQVSNQYAELGSESEGEVLDDEFYVDYTGELYKHSLSTWTKQNDRLDKLLCAPVLVCTIDHLIPATEGTKGGKQIGPMLRLLTGDLILDEPDDFGLEDLPALCRLVHWAAMLGSKVLLSTATMPPALSSALFESYKAGWAQYAKANLATWDGNICCAWFDEFATSDVDKRMVADAAIFKKQHSRFVSQRTKKLLSQKVINRLGELAIVETDSATSTINSLSSVIVENVLKLHQRHHVSDGKRNVSIGLVRMANINPLVEVAKALLKLDAPEDTCIHYCVYHSRYPLAIRSHIEQKLDKILKRKDSDSLWQADSEVGRILGELPESNHVFVVLASPVAEVGRDHDYDWAIAEPSSMRSVIQLAGRLLRHRAEAQPTTPNIVLLNKNLKALKGNKICFEKPGFEMENIKLSSHDLKECLHESQYSKITATPRITLPDTKDYTPTDKNEYVNLSALEHKALAWQLFTGDKHAKIWWDKQPYWCGEVQRQQRFRQSNNDEAYYLYVDDEYKTPYWRWLNEESYPPKLGEPSSISISTQKGLIHGNNSHFWFDLSPLAIYSELADAFGFDLTEVSRNFGELRVTEYEKNDRDEYFYHDNLGLYQELDNQ